MSPLYPHAPRNELLKPGEGANLGTTKQPSIKDSGTEETLVSIVINLRTDHGESQSRRELWEGTGQLLDESTGALQPEMPKASTV